MAVGSAEIPCLWRQTCDEICRKSESLYNNYFRNITALALDGEVLVLGISDEFFAGFVMENYGAELNAAIETVFGRELRIRFEYGHHPEPAEPEIRTEDAVPEPEVPAEPETPVFRKPAENCKTEYTFDSFVVGEENKYAFAAAMTAAQTPGKFNPLYIYGGSGMGKTHLIQAVANDVAAHHPDARIRYTTCEEFLNEYVASLRSKTDFKFRDHFRNVDLLIVDDVHFLSGNKVQLQEEFFNTFNALYNAGKQIIMTSDKQPTEIPGLEKRLVSRFQSGMTAQITSPSTYETRLAILRQAQESLSPKLSDEVLKFLAARITSNIRPLKSAQIRLTVYSNVGTCTITVQKAGELLSDLLDKEAEEKSQRVTAEAIQKAVAEHFNLQVRDLTGTKRPENIARARMIAMYLCRKLTEQSLQEIGLAFGGRKHATVIHAVSQIEKIAADDENTKRSLSTLQRKLQAQ